VGDVPFRVFVEVAFEFVVAGRQRRFDTQDVRAKDGLDLR
jgi:hypothetical protein